MGSDFRVNLYRKIAVVDENGVVNPKNPAQSGNPAQFGNPAQSGNPTQTSKVTFSDNELLVIQFVRDNHICTTSDIAELLSVKDRRARYILGNLVKKQILGKTGKARNTMYIVGERFPK